MAFVPYYILILYFTIIVDYFAGIYIYESSGKRKTYYFIFSIAINICVLGFFKYFNFFNENIMEIANFLNWNYSVESLKIILPIGLSFHTFQAMSYLIEIYRGNQKPEKHFGIYSLYVMYFPQLVAGPIERPGNLLHQFYEKHDFDYNRVSNGLKRMAWGFFKKCVIADRLAFFVDLVYNNPSDFNGFHIFIASVFFVFQLYCDFSGYSDIAIGSSQIMGIKLMENFKWPLISETMTEFWRRWHISLSSWFNDYLYTPIVWYYRDLGNASIIIAIFITFFLSGLWHGAGWNFILYGILFGIALIFEFRTKKIRKKLSRKMPFWLFRALSIFFTFMYLTFCVIFFRSGSITDAFYMIIKMFDFSFSQLSLSMFGEGKEEIELLLSVLLIIFLEFVQYFERNNKIDILIEKRHPLIRYAVYFTIINIIVYFGIFKNQQFIYFQF